MYNLFIQRVIKLPFSKRSQSGRVSPETIFWLKKWALLTTVGACFVSTVDAALLQKKIGLFTGGFLADFNIHSMAPRLKFFASSLICDFGVIGIFIMLSFFLLRRWRANKRVWEVSALALSVSPLLAVDLIKYKLEMYIGDIFKLVIFFDLTGKNPLEFLAVSYSQIMLLGLFGLLVAVTAFITIRGLKKLRRQREVLSPLAFTRKVLWIPVFGFVFSVLYSTSVRLRSEYLDSSLRRKPSGFITGVVVNQLSDFDGDGFGLLKKPPDPNPFDSQIYPYAIDYPGNGIDENGLGGDLPLKNSVYSEPAFGMDPWVVKPNIIFIMLESFRFDLIEKKSGGRAVTPVMDKLARNGLFSRNAFSHNGFTSQSRYHTLTGKFLRHGKSLIHDFKKNNYFVAFFSAQDVSFGGEALGFGFDEADISYDARVEPHLRFSTFSTPGSISLSHKVMKQKIHEFFLSYQDDNPLFLYINFQDSHFPYWNRDILPSLNDVKLKRNQIVPEKRDELLSMYENTAANIDQTIGEILREAKRVLGENVAVVITSDHGESLFDDGFLGHGHRLNDHQTRIPLIISGLSAAVQEPFGQRDLRGIINTALSTKQPLLSKPVKMENREKKIFQYIGDLDKPGQIGFFQNNRRLVYDFHKEAVKDWAGKWKRIGELSESSREDLKGLIYLWESMVLANQKVSVVR
ncbi:MAG: sulfatase-like hydrolase/transferase [Nitrospinota bacterium]